MIRVLFLTLALFSAQAGPAVMASLSVPLRTLRPYPTLLATLGVMPVPTNLPPPILANLTPAATGSISKPKTTSSHSTTPMEVSSLAVAQPEPPRSITGATAPETTARLTTRFRTRAPAVIPAERSLKRVCPVSALIASQISISN